MNMPRSYHADGSRCVDQMSCDDPFHTTVPPVCGAMSSDAAVGEAVACDLASGHPGPHVHAATGCQFGAR